MPWAGPPGTNHYSAIYSIPPLSLSMISWVLKNKRKNFISSHPTPHTSSSVVFVSLLTISLSDVSREKLYVHHKAQSGPRDPILRGKKIARLHVRRTAGSTCWQGRHCRTCSLALVWLDPEMGRLVVCWPCPGFRLCPFDVIWESISLDCVLINITF